VNHLKKYFLLFISIVTASALLFLYNNDVILVFRQPYAIEPEHHATEKKVPLMVFQNEKKTSENITIPLLPTIEDTFMYALQSWLTIERNNQLVPEKVTVQSVAFSKTQKILCVSFSQSIFNKQDAIHQKALLLKSLCSLIKELSPKTESLYLLVDQKPFNDPHLSCKQAISITHFIKL